jgi:hypothetical protein
MLTKEQMENNKNEFINLIMGINREGANIPALIKKLESSDFFYAPASTKYHGAYAGGLCEHSLNVYYNLVSLCKNKQGLDSECYDDNTLRIVGLLHDISKMNIYTITAKNEKVYCPEGDKHDELGRFKWVSKQGYMLKEERFVYGSHEMASEYIIRNYIPMTLAESVSVLHHMGGMNWDSAKDDLSRVFRQYSLSLMLHTADMLATYVDERDYDE